MKILITGASGFIGSELCQRLSANYDVVGIDNKTIDSKTYITECIDITNKPELFSKLSNKSFDFIIHCAGLAHQKIGTYDKETYMKVNCEVTEDLAKIATAKNPDLHFIFLSSISIYGENKLIQPIDEKADKAPSSDYAFSKLGAENRLINLYEKGILRKLYILRLAPVYDIDWAFNLERRILAPKKLAYIKFGKGKQKISALARANLVDFIYLLIDQSQESSIKVMNVCDTKPYRFDDIIRIFKNSNIYPSRPTVTIPLSLVWFATRLVALIFKNKKNWIHSCYDKLAADLTFDNSRMLATGFKPCHNLETIFCKEERH